MAAGRGGGGQRRLSREAGGGVAIDEAAVAGRESRQGSAVDLGLVVGGDHQRHRGDGESSGHVADAVVGVDRAAGGDAVGVARNVAAGRGRCRQCRLSGEAGRGVAIDEARVARREGRQRGAVDLGLVDGRDVSGAGVTVKVPAT